jgi:hypothetical protein
MHLQAVSPTAQFQGDQGGKFHPLTRLSPVEMEASNLLSQIFLWESHRWDQKIPLIPKNNANKYEKHESVYNI